MMAWKDKIWNRNMLAVMALSVVVTVLIASGINKQLSPWAFQYRHSSLDQVADISYKPPREADLQEPLKNITEIQSDKETIKYLAKLIYNAKKHVRGSKTSAYLGRAFLVLNQLLKSMNVSPVTFYKRKTRDPINVCSESFKGGKYGFPLYHTGWLRHSCFKSVEMSKLITIVKYFNVTNNDLSLDIVNKFILSASHTLPGAKLLVSINSPRIAANLQNKYESNIFYVTYHSEGNALNKMILNVKTQYVLVARDAEFLTKDIRLERLIYEMESLGIVLAGGSFRNRNGHWTKGCFQVLYRNFTLKYYEGYDESLHECLFCDFISGPFVSTTEYLVKHKFEDLHENNGLYEDLFLRSFQKGGESIVCPDSMFHTHLGSSRYSQWKQFMHKWRVNKIVTANRLTINLSSDIKSQKGKRYQIMNLNRLQRASDAVKVTMLACIQAGVVCELQEGTELGAVKMVKTLPWDIDFDIRFVSNNCSQCRRLADVFRKRGIHFGNFVNTCCTKTLKLGQLNYVGMTYKGCYGDFTGHPVLDSALLLEKGIEPTKILFDGVWLNVPRNPGLSMRNRYGREIYQHAEHWRYTGGNAKTGFGKMNYTTNVFLPCSTPGSHDCLDRFNADGIMQFSYLLP